MFEMASSPMILLDRHCRICRFNGYAEETFGYAKEEVIGQNIKVNHHRVIFGGEAYGYTHPQHDCHTLVCKPALAVHSPLDPKDCPQVTHAAAKPQVIVPGAALAG